MDATPGEGALRVARSCARLYLREHNVHERFHEDMEQEACAALVVEWPKLCERYPEGFGPGMIQRVVGRRLVDALRRELGRTGRMKAHAMAWTTEMQYVEIADDERVEASALRELELADTIEVLVSPLAPDDRYRLVCRGLAQGLSQREIADELHLSESRVSQLVRELREGRSIARR